MLYSSVSAYPFILPRVGGRKVWLMAMLLLVVGYAMTIFVTNIYFVLFSYGILPGNGLLPIIPRQIIVVATNNWIVHKYSN